MIRCFIISGSLVIKYTFTFKFFFVLFRKSHDSQKELKLLLDMYKAAPKEQRDKVQVSDVGV